MKWFVVVALVLCGCPVPEPIEDAGTLPDGGPCPKELVLGTEADGGFVAVADGMDLKINAGPQGGWHVWVSVKASVMPQSGTLSYVLRSNSAVISAPLRLDLASSPVDPVSCGWERRSDALTFESSGEPYRGGPGELEVRLETFGSAPVVVKRAVSLR